MKPVVIIIILCLLASVLGGIYRVTCTQDPSTTTKCDVAFGVPVVVLLAVACGVSGLFVLAINQGNGK